MFPAFCAFFPNIFFLTLKQTICKQKFSVKKKKVKNILSKTETKILSELKDQ